MSWVILTVVDKKVDKKGYNTMKVLSDNDLKLCVKLTKDLTKVYKCGIMWYILVVNKIITRF